jgi:hypothetical protein
MILLAPSSAHAQSAGAGADATILRRAQDDFARLSAELDRVNAEVAVLKRAGRSVRNDYRLGERMADAEALAQKVTQAEARLRKLRGAGEPSLGRGASIAPPQPLPQDGSVELEAKADLFSDQAKKLSGQADILASAAEQLRSRRALHRRAGAWDRDPFSGLESSKRNLGNSAQKLASSGLTPGASTSDSSRGTTSPPATTTVASGTAQSPTLSPSPPPPLTIALPGSGETSVATASPAPESATSAKSSPLSQTAPSQLSVEQHLFLDPATAAELRQALGPVDSPLDPDALDRAAATLHARARALDEEARRLRSQSRAP